eukprot:CAMPEP_0204914442 /NCGR_PEP_ID=MMETSP1397-20131031/12316_1 /ASSEMBLY_ACC=CAM_ASM_000891 /TAXON_ID=49980 /ORGANISM="Climacostomum Climacostomum virens, Strain Stock W-24" /LENGTH=160 /DNA_ID=CAMNT_0052086015 /DNA_START=307 /DNA_END=785 /DNA_ORIENTATION=-
MLSPTSSKRIVKIGFSEYIKTTMQRNARRKEERKETETPDNYASYTELIHKSIVKRAQKQLKKFPNRSVSTVNLDFKHSEMRPYEESKMNMTTKFDRSSIYDSIYAVSSSSLPPEKLVRKIVNLPKSPFGVHKDVNFKLSEKYVAPVMCSTWVNINNSKR